MNDNITLQELSSIGFSNYSLTNSGILYYNSPSPKEINKDKNNRFMLINDKGEKKRISLKKLYRILFQKEYCRDDIINLYNEQWKEIPNTKGKYFISNCGRVKSYCGYNAIILTPYTKYNGYLEVKICGRKQMIHKLVADAFCQNNYADQKVQVHHTDSNRKNNNATNLEILSIKEHHQRHIKGKSKKQ